MASRKNMFEESETNKRESPEPSCVSLKSNQSLCEPFNFSSGDSPGDVSAIQRECPEPSCVSLKSNQSLCEPFNFSSGDSLGDVSKKQEQSSREKQLDSIFKELEHKVNSELQKFKTLLGAKFPEYSGREVIEEEDEGQSKVRDGLLKVTLQVLRNMEQTELAIALQTRNASFCLIKHKSRLKEKFLRINEGISHQGGSIPLNVIYTDLYITEGGSGDVNNEHEVRQIETLSWTPETQEAPIKCNDIFKALPGQNKPVRTVLTKGIAGIGKTVSVQKFILDWAERKANQDIHLIFPLPFRELNLMKQKKISLMKLLHYFFKDTQELSTTDFDNFNLLFIFDGLDECRLPLDFSNNDSLFDDTEPASVDVLLTNLIKGNLLPSALLWITSRPAAANQIPPECVDQVTDVRGFNDPQKDEYFRKRINNQSLANRILTHIKSSRSLYIMCHIPVFCWISATVLERMLSEAESAEIPKTLTQMFTHFLIFQTKLKSLKYDGKYKVDVDEARESILSLGKLAFEQMEKGNLIFYEKDLKECGIDVRDASVYSGVCTQIFREEFELLLAKVYSFVHLSVQEFLAALFKFLSFTQDKSVEGSITDLLKSEVNKALRNANGHWDLYLRFLLGLSLESNQTLLRDLLTQTGQSSNTRKELVEHIKMKIKDNSSPEKSINLFHCLNELNDNSLVQEVQKYVRKTGDTCLSGVKLSPAQWSALVFVLLNSEEGLDEFNLRNYEPSEEGLFRLLPVIKASRKSDLSDCNLTETACSALASLLSSNSNLRELNLSVNNLKSSGVKLLSSGIQNLKCKLHTLKLYKCDIGEEGCAALASALISNPSHLRELNLNCNTPGDSGVKKLSDLIRVPNCKLRKLLLYHCNIKEEGCAALASALISNPSHLRELNLNNNSFRESALKLGHLLKDSHCKLEILQLEGCSIGEKGCSALALALISNPSHLRELNLSRNKFRDSGLKLLSDFLKNPQCKLNKLKLCDCNVSEKGCGALASALRSNPSHLRELDLNKNELGDSGVKLLSNLLKDPHCELKKLWLENCCIGEEGCAALVSALISNPSQLRELNLSWNTPGDSGVKKLTELLNNPHCKLEKLLLFNCSIGEEGCVALVSALRSNPSHLRELKFSENDQGDLDWSSASCCTEGSTAIG